MKAEIKPDWREQCKNCFFKEGDNDKSSQCTYPGKLDIEVKNGIAVCHSFKRKVKNE